MGNKVFLSYSREDVEPAGQIRTELAAAGHDVWTDVENLRGGDRWKAGIVEAIEGAEGFVVVLSYHSVTSDNAVIKVSIASEQGTRMIPVRLDDAEATGGSGYALTGVQEVDVAVDRESGRHLLFASIDPPDTSDVRTEIRREARSGRRCLGVRPRSVRARSQGVVAHEHLLRWLCGG